MIFILTCILLYILLSEVCYNPSCIMHNYSVTVYVHVELEFA